MAKKSGEQKPSETALFAALRRFLAYKEHQNKKFGPDYLAECFLPPHFKFFLKFEKIRANTKNKLAAFMPGLSEAMIARTAYFDRLFADALNDRTPQIVLLGAGYDSRAYRLAKLNRGSTVFELDLAQTQNRKKKCLQSARVAIPPQVKFVPVDFNQQPLGDVLDKAGYSKREKTLFLWEGVSYYLDVASVNATLEFVSHCSHQGSAIAFDYALAVNDENVDRYYGAREFAQSMKEHHTAEELIFSIAEGEIEPFLAQRGLKMVEHLDNAEIEKAYLVDEKGSLLGHMTGHFRFVLASPES